ncbi:MAG: iron-containing alcohol dehydrogenase [Candidatus Kapaibacterium sp.]
MENFKYYNPTKIVFGKDTVPQIGEIISKYSYKKVLLLYGGGSIKKNGVYDCVVNSLNQHSIEFVEFGGVQPNPVLSHAREAINAARANQVDSILAVGGGSVLDEAKAIAAGFYVNDVWNLFEKTEHASKALPLFTVLTLSATGSEMNSYGVLTNAEEKKKWSFGSRYTYPLVSIIDPTVQMSLPWRQTVNGGVDSMSHILEYYFTGPESETTLSINEALLKTIIKSVNELQVKEQDYKNRSELSWTASLALSGLTGAGMNGGEWTVHGIEHAISALFPQVAHAEGLAVLFPAWMKYYSDNKPDRYIRFATNLFNEDSVEGGIRAFQNLLKRWKAPITLGDLNISESNIPSLAENAIMTGNLGNHYQTDYNDVVRILKLAL